MESSAEECLYRAVLREDLDAVAAQLARGANPNKTTSQGRTSLGAAAHSGNLMIMRPLLDCSTVPTDGGSSMRKRHHRSHKRRLKRDPTWVETSRKCKNVGDFKSTAGGMISLADRTVPRLFGDDSTLCRNRGYFVFIHDDLHATDSEEGRLCFSTSSGTPVTPSTPSPLDLEWDEEVCNVAPTTREDETWSSLYRWYAAILECTGAALACAAAIPSGIDQQDDFMRTAAHYAAEQGHAQALNMLIEAGCKVDISAGEGLTPLHVAVCRNHTVVVRLLLDAGAHVNNSTNEKMTALHFAATRGYLEMVEMLVRAGASMEARDTSERTALFLAAGRGHHEVLQLLISAGANVNGEEIHGYTPLCEAVWQRDALAVRELLAAGARVTHSHRLLHNAILQRQEDIVTLLAAAGGINLHDDNGDTPLLLAARTSQPTLALILLQHGANVNSSDSITGATALHIAVERIDSAEQLEELLLCLLEHGVDVNATSLTGDTALNRAILLHRDHAVTLLVRHGADVNACYLQACALDNLTLISRRRSPNLARLLIKAGHVLPLPLTNQPVPVPGTTAHYIYHACRNPLLLTDLCRLKIRSFHRTIPLKSFVTALMLPKQLIYFLMLEDEG